MNNVTILGGGFGGLATAHELKRLLGDEVEVRVVDRGAEFMVGFRKTWALLGMSTLERGQRPLSNLEHYGIDYLQGTVTAIDPASHSAVVDGQSLAADALVVALGAEFDTESVPGFAEHAHNVYSSGDLADVQTAIQGFSNGRILVGIFGEPYKCPPAPYELAFLLRDHFQDRVDEVSIDVFTPKPMSLPILGDAGCSIIEGRLDGKGIGFHPNHKPVSVGETEVRFSTGRLPYDLLLGIPAHRCPQVVVQSGLAQDGGWVTVDPETLETDHPGVYAIGDINHVEMANGKRLPMAGVFAEGQGKIVARRIAAQFQGDAPEAMYRGEGFCFLELGGGEATLVQGNFLARPKPTVELTEVSPEFVKQKEAFETERLEAWLGT